jgi:hypothetical protein
VECGEGLGKERGCGVDIMQGPMKAHAVDPQYEVGHDSGFMHWEAFNGAKRSRQIRHIARCHTNRDADIY